MTRYSGLCGVRGRVLVLKHMREYKPPSLCPAGRGCLVSAISFLPGAEGIAWSTSVGHLPRRCFDPRGPRCGTHLQKVVV